MPVTDRKAAATAREALVPRASAGMRETRDLMGMPITVEIAEPASQEDLDAAFSYLEKVDRRFSTYKPYSEISRINRAEIQPYEYSGEMQEIFLLAQKTKGESNGYFDMRREDGMLDPSGVVKGWAIKNVAHILKTRGFTNFFVDAGGDIAVSGVNRSGEGWRVGIRNPFSREQVVKVILPGTHGVATSGTYVRGDHIYDPHQPGKKIDDIVSLTVIASDVLEADRFATAAFAMGKEGIRFIESLTGCEGYQIAADGMATMTTGFATFCA